MVIPFLSILFGAFYGVVLSFILSFFIMFFGGILAGGLGTGSILGELWLYYATVVPFAIVFMVLAIYFRKVGKFTKMAHWKMSAIVGLFLSWYSGTIGTLFGEYLVRGGLKTGGYVYVNVEGTLIWGNIYSFALLPIIIPLTFVLISYFRYLLSGLKLLPDQG